MIDCRLPRRAPSADTVSVLHPALNRLTDAWARACATRADVAILAAMAPRMLPVSPAQGHWVLQGVTAGGGAVCASLTDDDALSIIATGPAHPVVALLIPLADLARVKIHAA